MKNLVQQTQLESYHGLRDVGAKQEIVYRAISTLGRASDYDVANYLNLPINRITPRRNELFRMGLVKEATRDISPHTGKRVIFWTIAEWDLPEKKVTNSIVKKKKGYFHVECGGRMKIEIHTTDPIGQTIQVKRLLVCACGYKHELE